MLLPMFSKDARQTAQVHSTAQTNRINTPHARTITAEMEGVLSPKSAQLFQQHSLTFRSDCPVAR
jgi:hypothetical protein